MIAVRNSASVESSKKSAIAHLMEKAILGFTPISFEFDPTRFGTDRLAVIGFSRYRHPIKWWTSPYLSKIHFSDDTTVIVDAANQVITAYTEGADRVTVQPKEGEDVVDLAQRFKEEVKAMDDDEFWHWLDQLPESKRKEIDQAVIDAKHSADAERLLNDIWVKTKTTGPVATPVQNG